MVEDDSNGKITCDLYGAALASLEPQQTSRRENAYEKRCRKSEEAGAAHLERWYRQWQGTVERAEPEETRFRHSGWAGDRRLVVAALVRTGTPAGRIDRFANCGAGCRVFASADGKKFKLKAQYCGDRWCTPCCKARAVRIVGAVVKVAGRHQVRFVTLTARPAGETLAQCLKHVLESFDRLRRCEWWRKNVNGGAFTVEVTRGERGDHWHVHIHCLCTGGFIEQRRLSDLWRVASRGSYIVDVRSAGNDGRIVEYFASYAAKGWSRDVLIDPDACDEAMLALKGRRLIATFGSWYGRPLLERPADSTDWKPLGRLPSIIAAAAAGEEWARAVLIALHVNPDGSRKSRQKRKLPRSRSRDPAGKIPPLVAPIARNADFAGPSYR